MARSSLRLVTRSATAVPSELEVRLRPLDSRRHQLSFGAFRSVVHVGGVLAVSRHERKSRPNDPVPELTAEEIQSRVLHRDGLMLVIDKPAGLPVHRGPKGGANLETSFDALRFGLPRPPVLAHRLDRDTSGCLVLGTPSQGDGLARPVVQARQDFERPIGPWSKAAQPKMKAPSTCRSAASMPSAAGGRSSIRRARSAVTNWKVLGRGGGLTWLALEPVTGRTHQLRVHTSARAGRSSATTSMAMVRASANRACICIPAKS